MSTTSGHEIAAALIAVAANQGPKSVDAYVAEAACLRVAELAVATEGAAKVLKDLLDRLVEEGGAQ
jgi:hypothetical protein